MPESVKRPSALVTILKVRGWLSDQVPAWHDNEVSSAPQRIVMVLPNDGPGGMQAQVRTISEGLAAAGHHVVVLIGGGQFAGERDGVTYRIAPPLHSRRPWEFLRELRRIVATESATVVHGHGLRTGPLVAFAGRQTKRFVTCHGIDPAAIPIRLLRLLRRLPVVVVSCGEGPASQMLEYGLASRVLNNAVAPSTHSGTRQAFDERFGTSGQFVAMWPARFSTQKGHKALLEFAEALRGENVQILCCGDGPLRTDLERDIAAKLLGDIVVVRDFEPDASQWFEATDFFVLPSLWEGQPLVMLEAMRAGVPIVSWTPVGVELLHPSARVGSPQEGATLVRSWIRDRTSANGQIARHHAVADQHELPIVLHEYESLYSLS